MQQFLVSILTSRSRAIQSRLSTHAIACLSLLLCACAGVPTTSHPVAHNAPNHHLPPLSTDELATRETLLETALGQLGRPYRYGGGDGDGFDCSGLVQFVYSQAGIQLPRTAAQQSAYGQVISLDEAAPGDLVFFKIGGGTHVSIYVGDDRVVHAPSTGQEVKVTSISSDYWRDHYSGAVRVLR